MFKRLLIFLHYLNRFGERGTKTEPQDTRPSFVTAVSHKELSVSFTFDVGAKDSVVDLKSAPRPAIKRKHAQSRVALNTFYFFFGLW
jgi:hypothetical protein